MNAKEHLSIFWSGFWRMLLITIAFVAYITLCFWLEWWSLLLVLFTLFMVFSYMVGTLVHDFDDTHHSPHKKDDEK